jgi:hypothetical protein
MPRPINTSPIATVAEQLQKMPPQLHWAVADSLLLISIGRHQPVARGRAGTRLGTLVKLFDRFGLVYPLLLAVGSFELTRLLLQQGRKSELPGSAGPNPAGQYPASLFVGFCAGSEETLFAGYCSEKAAPVARIDQTKVETMGQWHRVGVIQALGALKHSLTLARQGMASLPNEYNPWKLDFLTFVGMRLGYYSFTSAWFSQLKANSPEIKEICFLAADTSAFAAVNTGQRTRYLQHGMIRHSLILPDFTYVDTTTHYEALHFQQRLPRAKVRLTRLVALPMPRRTFGTVLVASTYATHQEMCRILPFLEFAAQLGMNIHVRPHPAEDRSFWQAADLPSSVRMEDSDISFDAALDRLRPSLVVSWFSTTLVDALYRGLIPVSVSAIDDQNIQDMVYPIIRHCLHWPSDRDQLENVVSDEHIYDSTLARLRAGME